MASMTSIQHASRSNPSGFHTPPTCWIAAQPPLAFACDSAREQAWLLLESGRELAPLPPDGMAGMGPAMPGA